MARLKLTAWGKEHEITLDISHYANNDNLYIGLVCWEDIGNGEYPEPWSDLTVNLDIRCRPNCAFIDINDNGKEIIDWLMANKLGTPTGRVAHSGFCAYPEFEFNMNEVNKYVEEI
jgi:hypothetical protein